MIFPPPGLKIERTPPPEFKTARRFNHTPGESPKKLLIPFGRDFYGLLLIFVTSTSVKLVEKWQDTEKKRNEAEKQKLFAELTYLKKQVNPHFLFNALNNIYSLSLSKSEQTTSSILKLSSILRYMLYETNNRVSLREEIDIINDYIELQKFRITDLVKINFHVSGNPEDYKIEPLLLLPVVENAFKFGVDNVNDSFIDIFIEISSDILNFKVKNKIVHTPVRNNEDFGIGMKNIIRRLELLYPDSHTFSYNEIDDVYLVEFIVKLKK